MSKLLIIEDKYPNFKFQNVENLAEKKQLRKEGGRDGGRPIMKSGPMISAKCIFTDSTFVRQDHANFLD